MASKYTVCRAISGGVELSGPYDALDKAMEKACELVNAHGATAIISIEDDEGFVIGANEVHEKCKQLAPP